MLTRTLFLIGAVLSSAGDGIHAAPSDECPELAKSFHNSVFVMDTTSLGRLRKCAQGEPWSVTKPPNTAASASSKQAAPLNFSLAGQVDKSCGPLAETVSHDGTKSLEQGARVMYRVCVDKAITYVSSQRKPPAIANHPNSGRRPGNDV